MLLRHKVLVTGAACSLAASCGRSSPTRVERALPSPRSVGTIMLLGAELPDVGTVIGGHFEGRLYEERRFSYRLTSSVRSAWSQGARERGEAVLRGAGFRVQAVGPASSDAQRLEGVQFGLAGRVTALEVRTTGPEPLRVESRVEVAWEVLDLGRGASIFGRRVAGGARLTGTVDSAVARALDGTLSRFVADTAFLRTLAAPPVAVEMAAARWRDLPGPRELITLSTEDLNPSGDTDAVARVAAGLVTLRSTDRAYGGTAVLLTRDGLALATARTARRIARVRARLPTGVERPVRVVRRHGGLNVALLQVACPGDCVTVDWEAPDGVPVHTQVLVVGAPGDDDVYGLTVGRVGGRWGLASGVTLETPQDQLAVPGEPVARASSGKVFALVSSQPGRQSVLLLAEVLRALRVRPPAR